MKDINEFKSCIYCTFFQLVLFIRYIGTHLSQEFKLVNGLQDLKW